MAESAPDGASGRRHLALLIWNPVAGRRPGQHRRHVEELARGLTLGGWHPEIVATDAARGAAPASEQALAAGVSTIVACGGDGTLNEVVNVVAGSASASPPSIGVAPMGTANIVAHALGVPRPAAAAAKWMLRAQPVVCPLGRAVTPAGARYFAAVASAGLDAQAVHHLDLGAKVRWGKLAYVAAAARCWRQGMPAPIQVAAPGHAAQAQGAIFGLTSYYGGRFRLGPTRSGEAIALLLRGGRGLQACQALWLATHQLQSAPGVERWRVRSLEVITPDIPLQLDGEPAGFSPVTWQLCERGIRLLGT